MRPICSRSHSEQLQPLGRVQPTGLLQVWLNSAKCWFSRCFSSRESDLVEVASLVRDFNSIEISESISANKSTKSSSKTSRGVLMGIRWWPTTESKHQALIPDVGTNPQDAEQTQHSLGWRTSENTRKQIDNTRQLNHKTRSTREIEKKSTPR